MVDPSTPINRPTVETLAFGDINWVYLEQPSQSDVESLNDRFGIHQLHLAECLARRQRPKVEIHETYVAISLQFPVYGRLARVPVPGHFNAFLGSDFLVTLHRGDLRQLSRLFRECQADEKLRSHVMGRGPGFLLFNVLDRLIDGCHAPLDNLGANVTSLHDLFASPGDRVSSSPGGWAETIQQIALRRRETLALVRIVGPQIGAIRALPPLAEQGRLPGETELLHWTSLVGRLEQISYALEEADEMVAGLEATANTLSLHRVGEAVRVLAYVAGAILPLIVIGVLFTMNLVELPLATYPYAFEVILAGMGITLVFALYLLRRRPWL